MPIFPFPPAVETSHCLLTQCYLSGKINSGRYHWRKTCICPAYVTACPSYYSGLDVGLEKCICVSYGHAGKRYALGDGQTSRLCLKMPCANIGGVIIGANSQEREEQKRIIYPNQIVISSPNCCCTREPNHQFSYTILAGLELLLI